MEKSVAELAKLFNIEPDTVRAAIEDDSLSQRVKDWKEKNEFFSKEDLDKMKANLREEAQKDATSGLVDKAKKGELQKDLYDTIKGSTLEMTEKDLKKKYDVDFSYSGLNDLVGKLIEKKQSGTPTDELKTLQEEKADLQNQIKALQEEKENEISQLKQGFKVEKINGKLDELVGTIPLDLSSYSKEEKPEVEKKTRDMLKKLFTSEYTLDLSDDLKSVQVLDTEGNLLKDQLHNPQEPSKVMLDVAKNYNIKLKQEEKGGAGGGDPQVTDGSNIGEITSQEDYNKLREKRGIEPGSSEDVDLMGEVLKENPDFQP